MRIDKIKEIVNSKSTDIIKENQIIEELSKDKNVIPTLLKILDRERINKEELLMDMNLELSRADIHIKEPTLACGEINKKIPKNKIEEVKLKQAKDYVLNNISNFYKKYEELIKHCFIQ